MSFYHRRYWLKRRKEILKKKGGYCKICHTRNRLAVHHRDSNINNNTDENLIILCNRHQLGIEAKLYRMRSGETGWHKPETVKTVMLDELLQIYTH